MIIKLVSRDTAGQEIFKIMPLNYNNSIFFLVGNKSDIFGGKREDIINQGQSFADDIDANFIKCPTKCKDNMDNLERYITTEVKRFIDDEEKYNNVLNNINTI